MCPSVEPRGAAQLNGDAAGRREDAGPDEEVEVPLMAADFLALLAWEEHMMALVAQVRADEDRE